jgi:hypothetical protein
VCGFVRWQVLNENNSPYTDKQALFKYNGQAYYTITAFLVNFHDSGQFIKAGVFGQGSLTDGEDSVWLTSLY